MGDLLAPILTSPAFILTRNLLSLFVLVLWIATVFWTWRDADRRGSMAWFWAAVALVFPFAGVLVYLVVRPPEYADDVRERELEIRMKEIQLQVEAESCPSCYKAVEREFLLCPYCMKKLRKPCIECQRPLRLSWQVCPYCKTKQG